ncbi:MAG TPA: PAAR domain-containing protein [Bryobacteraceae bacterium]|nr:PAAR domain-containing protein [Bryobacteraceae bacterium]
MSGQPAARVGDEHLCPQSTGPVPHFGGPILPPGEPTVLIGGSPAARMSDQATCIGPIDMIARGAFPVPIGGKPAARMTDQTAHGGVIIVGCPTVLIGLAGTAGNVAAATSVCQAAANGRTSGSTQQTYNNCGVESSRQLINRATGANVSENTLLTGAINAGLANGTPGVAPTLPDGGTTPAARQTILANNGVPSTVVPTSPDAVGMAMSRGQGVIVSIDAAPLWGPPTPPGSFHALNVVGVEYDDNGNRTAVYVNDTGTGQCGQRVPANTFDQAVAARGGSMLNVTNNPVW